MEYKNKAGRDSAFLNIIIWGTIWGIFEITIGYFLHSISFAYTWIIWYPFACFIMTNVYRKNRRVSSIFFVGILCSSIKMLNLLLPGRIDKVINPAVSILFEALVMGLVIFAVNHVWGKRDKNPLIKAMIALFMNTGWRILYALYLLFLVPDWIRDISVISSMEKFIPFFVTQNLITTALIFIGYQFKDYIMKPVVLMEKRISSWCNMLSNHTLKLIKPFMAAFMLCANIALQFILK